MKNNFLSLKGMRLKGRRMNDPEITRKSRGNHAVITRFSRLITSTLLLLFTFAIGNVWAAVLWESDLQESISGVTVTKLNNSDSWVTDQNLDWAPGLTKAYLVSGSNRGVQLQFGTALSLQTGDVIRVFAGATNNTARTLSLFLNDGGSAVGTVTLPNSGLRVLDYELSSDLTLNKIQIKSSNNSTYIFRVVIFRGGPTTGETTISYETTYKGLDVQGRTSNLISTISNLSSAIAQTGLTTSTSNGQLCYSGEIKSVPSSESSSYYLDLQFEVADGYTFTPSSVVLKWQGKNTNHRAKASILDATTTVTSSESSNSSTTFSGLSNAASINFASGAFTNKSFVGVVHIRVYFYGNTASTYLGTALSITGTVASAVAPTNYTVTIDPNGGSYASTPDGWTYSAGVYTKSIASGTSFSAPAGLSNGTKDLTWKDGVGTDITFPQTITGDITFVAQWADHTESSDATLSALSVAGCTLNETFDPDDEDYTVDLPFYASMPVAGDVTATKNDEHAATPAVSVSGNEITIHCEAEDGTTTKDYTITVTIAPAPAASSSINIEQWVLDNGAGKGNGKVTEQTATLLAALTTANIAYTNANELDSLTTASGRNEPYLGLKFKSVSSTITIIVPAEQTLKVKFGERKTAVQVAINDGAASAATITDGIYSLAATSAVRQVKFSVTQDNKTIVLKQVMVGEDIKTVTLPWLVTYTVGEHGTCAKAKETWKGSALTLPAVTPESGWDFDGWFTAASAGTKVGGAGEEYTPTADVELFAQYTAQASPFDLTALTYKIGSAAAENVGYVDGKFTYNIELPYAPSYDAITVAPTLKESTSYLKGDEVLTVSSLPGAATFTVVAAGGSSEQLYTVNFTKAAKDGVCLIWGDVANNSLTRNATKSQLNGTLANSNVRDNAVVLDELTGPKFQSNGYLSIALEGQDIKAGDQVKIFVTSLNGLADKLRVFNANEAIDANIVAISAENMTTRVNTVTMTADASTIYLRRGNDYDSWNPCVAYVAVYRIMNPVLTAISFDGVDADKDSEFAFSATLPQGTNLGTMTITPAIVWNGAGTSAPTAAWAWGANTFRVTDKDGDYTDYTITLTEALAPSAAPTITTQPADGNYYECATISALEVVATGSGTLTYQWYLGSDEIDGATDATYTPTVTAIGTYEYHCVVTNTEAGHPATSLASDNATITISEDPAAIKLLDGSTVNHTHFITGVTADETVEFKGNTVNYAKFTGTVGGVNGVKDLTRVIAYNATTTQTKIQVSVHNNSTNARGCYVKGLVEGADEAVDLATIALGNKEDKVSDWITFDNAANRTIYIYVGSDAGDVYFTQVKVIESGTDLKMAGEAGYSLNFNKGRFFSLKDVTAHFEDLDVEVKSSDCQPLNTSVVKLASSSISFEVTASVILTVTTNNSSTYYVTKGSAGTDNETAKKGASEFNLTAGTWYITGGASNVEITNIAFALPKCEQPTITPMSDSELCEGDPFTALAVSASVSDGGTLHYQWYKHPAAGDDEAVGTDAASYTPEADGQYYVVVTNQLADHSDNSKTSNMVTVEHFASAVITAAPLNQRATVGNDVTLSVAATGKNVAYKWYTCNEDGSNEVALDPEQTGTSIGVTITAGLLQWYKVKVTSDCGNVEAMAKVEEFVPATPANVTESIVWDWKSTTAGFPTENTSIDFANTSVEQLFADVDAAMPNNAEFRSDMLYGIGQRAWRKSNNDGECGFQGFQIRFYTEVAGRVRVYFRAPSSGQTSVVTINGRQAGSRGNSWGWSEYVDVEANTNVIIAMTNGETGMTRVQKIEFQTPGYVRTEMLGAGVYGTICVDHNVPEGGVRGVTVYEIAGREPQYGKIAFDEVTEMAAGVPYVFIAHGNEMALYYGETTVANPVNGNGMYGTFVAQTLTELDGIYYFAKSALWSCVDLTSLNLPANRAYVKLSEIGYLGSSSPAPGRRRITLGVQGEQVATGIENGELNEAPRKVLINGELFILRGEKMYDAKGQLVK